MVVKVALKVVLVVLQLFQLLLPQVAVVEVMVKISTPFPQMLIKDFQVVLVVVQVHLYQVFLVIPVELAIVLLFLLLKEVMVHQLLGLKPQVLAVVEVLLRVLVEEVLVVEVVLVVLALQQI